MTGSKYDTEAVGFRRKAEAVGERCVGDTSRTETTGRGPHR
jgi:hypothetical protein